MLQGLAAGGASPGVDVVPLAPLRIEGHPIRAHTQGLEIVDGQYWVTARQDDVVPRRALILRYRDGDADWTAWNLTPEGGVLMDHPGGFQSDGHHLWIPLAESRRGGRSRVRAYPLTGFVAGQVPAPAVEFTVDDHIGALAVSRNSDLLVGAAWDTDTVYVWDLKGTLKQTLGGTALRQLGVGAGKAAGGGLAVQDWKFADGILWACGLVPVAGGAPISRLVGLNASWEPPPRVRDLPKMLGVELGREAMAISGKWIHFLPEDLGRTNRLFRIHRETLSL